LQYGGEPHRRRRVQRIRNPSHVEQED
jgi:hypothetical protein